VTLSGFTGGEYSPLPRSKGAAFPFLLTLGGCRTAPSNFARRQGILHHPLKSKGLRDLFLQEELES